MSIKNREAAQRNRRVFLSRAVVGSASIAAISSHSAYGQTEAGVRLDLTEQFVIGEDAAETTLDLALVEEPSIESAEAAATTAREAIGDAVEKSDQSGIDLARVEQIPLAQRILEAGETLDPKAYEEPLLGQTSVEFSEESSSLEEVIFNIIWDTIGIDASVRHGLTLSIQMLGLDEIMDQLQIAVREEDWYKCQRLIRRLLNRIVSTEALQVIEQQIGRDSMNALYRRLAARAVPFVGWAIFIAAAVFAIRNNLDRLRAFYQ
jgi:hypothetical protein